MYHSMNYSRLGKKELIAVIQNFEKKNADGDELQFRIKNAKLSEKQVKFDQSKDLYANLYDNSPVGLVTLDDKGIITDINITLSAMLGIDRRNIPGTPFVIYIVKENIPDYLNFLKEINKPNENNIIEFRLKCRNNEIRFVQMHSTLVFDYGSGTNLILNNIIDITDQKNDELELERALKEKIILVKEIHHRVKNNLQIISSLLSLQTYFIKNDQINEVITTSKNRIRTMALIHENLYKSNNLAEIHFNIYLKNLIKNIFESYTISGQNIHVKDEIADQDLDADTAIYIGMIINELITNSLKHAFKDRDAGEISIIFKSLERNKHQLEISDNGVGLPSGFDPNECKTLGFLLIHSFVEQLNGSMTVTQNKGTKFKIVF